MEMFNFCYLKGKKEGDAWFEPGFPSTPLGVWDGRMGQDKIEVYRHVGRGLLHKPADI